MKERLPKDIYKAFKQCLKLGETLTSDVAHGVAQAMSSGIASKPSSAADWRNPLIS